MICHQPDCHSSFGTSGGSSGIKRIALQRVCDVGLVLVHFTGDISSPQTSSPRLPGQQPCSLSRFGCDQAHPDAAKVIWLDKNRQKLYSPLPGNVLKDSSMHASRNAADTNSP